MSWETAQHIRLVEAAAAAIRLRHGHLYSLTVFVDLPATRRDRPRNIGGYIPDVFAVDAPETCRIIGEAKTSADCETDRSRLQIEAFLGHLAHFPNSSFYLCVPLLYRVRAESLLRSAAQTASALSVRTLVISDA